MVGDKIKPSSNTGLPLIVLRLSLKREIMRVDAGLVMATMAHTANVLLLLVSC